MGATPIQHAFKPWLQIGKEESLRRLMPTLFHPIPNADYLFSEPESEQRLIQQTNAFLLEHL
jgi:hypothetical protein